MSDCQGPVDELLAPRSLLRLNQNKRKQAATKVLKKQN